MEMTQNLTFATMIAFALGWAFAKLVAYVAKRFSERERDPRDNRIRALDAELRIARNECDKRSEEATASEKALEDAKREFENTEIHVKKQDELIASLQEDLRDSVKKTRELRAELTDRATESLRSEVKLREVETELSVAQASTDMIATGVLDYMVDEEDDDSESSSIQQSLI